MKVLIKDKDTLIEQLEDFITANKESFDQLQNSKLLNETTFRQNQMHVINCIAGKELECTKIMHKDNITYHYAFPWLNEQNETQYGYIDPQDVEMELKE